MSTGLYGIRTFKSCFSSPLLQELIGGRGVDVAFCRLGQCLAAIRNRRVGLLKMKILVVTQYFWPENFRINDLVLGLQERGHMVTVLTGLPNYPGGRLFPGYRLFPAKCERYYGIKVFRVPMIPRGKGTALRLIANYLSFALSASLLGPFYCRGQYDVILVYEPSPITVGIPAIVLKWIKRLPISLWVLDLWPESLSAAGGIKSPWVLRIVERLVRFIYRNTDLIMVQSRAFIPRVRALGVEADRIQYLPQWAEELYVPLEVEDNAPERAVLPKGFRVMFAGNIGAAQGFDTILSAAERLKGYPDIHWLILGDGRMRKWVEDEVQARGLSSTVHLLGRFPVEQMPRFFSLADVMLVTLKPDPIFSLTIPAKVQSYLACGKPVIAAMDGEGAKVVEEAGAGLLCPGGDPEALARSVLSMYEMPESERRAMGMRGRLYYEAHFARGTLLNRLNTWLEDVRRDLSMS